MFIYNWEGVFTPFVAGYAYFIVDQLQRDGDLKPYLDKHGGRWIINPLTTKNPILNGIQRTVDHLTFGDKMQLVHFVETHKSSLLESHNKSITIPDFLQVKLL